MKNAILSAVIAANIIVLVFVPFSAMASMPTHPENDANFLMLPNGVNLSTIRVSGVPLHLSVGTGDSFKSAQASAYMLLKNATKTEADHPVQWTLMDLDQHQVIDQSANASRPVFGASTSKIFVGGTLLDKENGELSSSQLQLMANMIVVSSNTAWITLQGEIGDGDQNRGREINYKFTQRLGLKRTRGYTGNLGNMHGNELTTTELAEYLYDIYQNRFPGAETIWKVMHTGRTGIVRARKYIPATQYIGGKTGTYDGPTIDPDTGLPTNRDGKPYTVRVRNQVIVFNIGGHEYGLAILANTGSDESAALMAGGLYRELAAAFVSAEPSDSLSETY